jgi:hypothetical protein
MKLIDKIAGIPTVIKLLFGTVILGLLALVVAENPFQFTDLVCRNILYGTICFIFIAIMTIEIFAAFFDTEDWLYIAFLVIGIPLFLGYITTAILFQQADFRFYQINFWLCLVCWVLSYIFRIKRTSNVTYDAEGIAIKPKPENVFEDLIIALSAAWAIASVFITLGVTIFDYARQPINSLKEIHSLLDIRFNLAIALGVLIAIKSIVFVLQNKKVQLIPLFKPREQVINSDEKLNPFLKGFSGFLNIAINLLGNIGNMLYKVFATIVLYLIYIGGEIYNSTSSLVRESVNLIFYILQFIAVITAFYFIHKLCNPLLVYLRESSWAISYSPLIMVIIFSIIIAICMIAINFFMTIDYSKKENKFERDVEQFNKSVARAMETLPYLIAVIWIAGVVLFLIAKIDFLNFSTFKIFGILSAILSSFVFVGFISYLINNFKPQTQTIPNNTQSKNENYNTRPGDKIDLDKVDDRTAQEVWEVKKKKKFSFGSFFKKKRTGNDEV